MGDISIPCRAGTSSRSARVYPDSMSSSNWVSHSKQQPLALKFSPGAKGDASALVHLRYLATSALTDADLKRDAMLLDGEETQKYRRFVAAEDRRAYGAAHALLRRMLTRAAPNVPPDAWRFERTARGKPYLPEAMVGAPPIRFSLSHARGHVVCAVSRDADIGVDTECGSQSVNVEMIMPGVCSNDEQAQVRAAAPAAQAHRYLDLWALKEAYLKARGMGLNGELDQISFDLRTPALISATSLHRRLRGWWFALFRPSAHCRIAVAVPLGRQTQLTLDAAIVARDGSQTPLQPVQMSSPVPATAPSPDGSASLME
jgi:4'-phosphopantetheinyl transferase